MGSERTVLGKSMLAHDNLAPSCSETRPSQNGKVSILRTGSSPGIRNVRSAVAYVVNTCTEVLPRVLEATTVQVFPKKLSRTTPNGATMGYSREKGVVTELAASTEQALCEAQPPTTQSLTNHRIWSYANSHRAVGLDRTAPSRNYSGRAAMLREQRIRRKGRFSKVSYADSALARSVVLGRLTVAERDRMEQFWTWTLTWTGLSTFAATSR